MYLYLWMQKKVHQVIMIQHIQSFIRTLNSPKNQYHRVKPKQYKLLAFIIQVKWRKLITSLPLKRQFSDLLHFQNFLLNCVFNYKPHNPSLCNKNLILSYDTEDTTIWPVYLKIRFNLSFLVLTGQKSRF